MVFWNSVAFLMIQWMLAIFFFCMCLTYRLIVLFHVLKLNKKINLTVGRTQKKAQSVTNQPNYITNEEHSYTEKDGMN